MEPNKSKIESKTTFNERRKELNHIVTEKRETELGLLVSTSNCIYHEKGIKKIVGDYKKRIKIFKKNIKILQENKEEAPKMTPELENLKKQLEILNMINYKGKVTLAEIKREAEDLKNNIEDLEKVEKDLKEITEAIGSRLKL